MEIERQPVNDTDEAIAADRHIEGNRVLLRVWSSGASHYVVVNGTKGS